MESFVFGDGWRLDGLTGRSVEDSGFEPSRGIELHAVRNEYASFQLAVKGADCALEDIRVSLELSGGVEGEAFYEWFHASGGKLVPDLLIPLDSVREVPLSDIAGRYHSSEYAVFWIDLFVPPNAEPGEYGGAVSIAAGGERSSHPIALTVHKPTLVDESLLFADMNNYADSVTRNFPYLAGNADRYTDGSYFAQESAFYRVSHEHRLLFHHLPYTHAGVNYTSFAPKLSGEGRDIRVSDWSLYDAHFGPYFDGSAFEGTKRGPIPAPYAYLPFCFDWPASYEKWGTEGFKIENRRVFLDFLRHFEEKGWTKTVFEVFFNHKKRYRFYPYDGDETRHQPDTEIIYAYNEILGDLMGLSEVRTLFRTDSSWSYGLHSESDIAEIIKMWTVGSGILQMYPESFQRMKKLGNTLWIYGGLPYMHSDMTALFEWPMRCLQCDIKGFLYWNATGIGKDFLACPTGDGCQTVYYPGHPFGLDRAVLPSIRMKYIRNAMQIADLIKMHEGTWTFHKMRDAVDDIYGVSRDEWHDELPDSLNIPPHEFTNELIGGAPRNRPSRNADPALPSRVKLRMIEMAESYRGGVSQWV